MEAGSPTPRRTSAANVLIALVFVAAILTPLIVSAVRGGSEGAAARENRQAETRPKWSWDGRAMKRYPELFSEWYDDAFGLRSDLVQLNSRLQVNLFRHAPAPRLLIGKDDWIFDTMSLGLETLRGVSPLSERELKLWTVAIESRRDWMHARGGTYISALIPRKGEVYLDKLPFALERVGPSRRVQLIDYLREHSDVPTIDLLPALVKAREADREGRHVYHPHGVHWTDEGAFVGYTAVMAELERAGAGVRAEPRSAFELRIDGALQDSWGRRLYMEERFEGSEEKLWRRAPARATRVQGKGRIGYRNESWQVDDPSLPTAVLLHDSFGEWIIPRFAEHFRELKTYRGGIFDPVTLAAEDPDVVIDVFSELLLVQSAPLLLATEMQDVLRGLFDASTETLADVPDVTDLRLEPPFESATLTAVDGSLIVDVERPGNALRLPRYAVPDAGLAVVAIDLEVPEASRIDVLFRAIEAHPFQPRRSVHVTTKVGRGRYFLPVTATNITGELILRVGTVKGRHTVRSVSVRAVPVDFGQR